MKTTFYAAMFCLVQILMMDSKSFAQNGPRMQLPALCSVKVWGQGKVHMDLRKQKILLEDSNQSEIPLEAYVADIATPAGPVSVLLDQAKISVHYSRDAAAPVGGVKPSENITSMFSSGQNSAELTVFLGPSRGDNNGINIQCERIPNVKPVVVENQ